MARDAMRPPDDMACCQLAFVRRMGLAVLAASLFVVTVSRAEPPHAAEAPLRVAPTGMNMIPSATFDMGEAGKVEPVTRVTMPSFLLDRTEVSVAAYAACVGRGACTDANVTSCGPGSNWGRPDRADHPMNCVDWMQARAFCLARGARLPTEAEWELGARGTDGRPYPWGTDPPDERRALFRVNREGPLTTEGVRMHAQAMVQRASEQAGTDPVDSHPEGASPFGLLNMAGNVWEWVQDVYAPYPGGSVRRPRGGADDDEGEHVVRGGGYSSMRAIGLRTFDREHTGARHRGATLGFRCARDLEP